MQVIGAGFGRTGTTSLKAALEQLGFGPCYHMSEVVKNRPDAAFWRKATRGENVDFRSFLRSYELTVDWPGCSFYRELMQAYPDAKVLLSVRDPEKWHESLREIDRALAVYYPLSRITPLAGLMGTIPIVGPGLRLISELIWEKTFQRRVGDRAHALDVYQRHIEEVKRHVPPERLLVYDVKEGWEPLCRFLGVPVPAGVQMPRLNDRRKIKWVMRGLHLVAASYVLFLLLLVLTAVVALRGKSGGGPG